MLREMSLNKYEAQIFQKVSATDVQRAFVRLEVAAKRVAIPKYTANKRYSSFL